MTAQEGDHSVPAEIDIDPRWLPLVTWKLAWHEILDPETVEVGDWVFNHGTYCWYAGEVKAVAAHLVTILWHNNSSTPLDVCSKAELPKYWHAKKES